MKRIGQTNDNGVLIELTDTEYRQLCRLINATGNRQEWEDNLELSSCCPTQFPAKYAPDMSSVFGAVAAFTHARFRITELQECVNALKTALHKEGE